MMIKVKKSKFYKISQSGFTIIEVIIAVAIFALLSWGIIYLVANVFTGASKQGTLLADADQARRTAFQLTSELRNAQTSNTGAYALDTAGDQELIFYSNVDGGLEIERIRYFIQNGQLRRGVVKPTGNPLTYNLGTETTSPVQNDLGNGSTPLFYYYDGSYNGAGAAMNQPVNVTAVKFVKLNLMVYNKGGQTVDRQFFIVTAGSAVRNLKTNLGN